MTESSKVLNNPSELRLMDLCFVQTRDKQKKKCARDKKKLLFFFAAETKVFSEFYSFNEYHLPCSCCIPDGLHRKVSQIRHVSS